MGLGDIYEGPMAQAIATGPEAKIRAGFNALPGLESQGLQNDYQRQQNKDQAYNSPSRAATHHETAIGEYVRKHFHENDPPGHAPGEAQARLMQEMGGQGGLSAPPPQGVTNSTPPPTYMGGGGPDQGSTLLDNAKDGGYGLSNTPMPSQTPGQGPDMGQSMPSGGLSRPSLGRPTMSMAGVNPPRGQAPNGMTSPPDNTPMTHGDVQEYMKMAPFLKMDQPKTPGRDFIAEENNKEVNREKLDTKKGATKQGLQTDSESNKNAIADADRKLKARIEWQKHLDRMEEIAARVKIGAGTAMDIAILNSMTRLKTSSDSDAARVRSSLSEIVGDEDAKGLADEQETQAKQLLLDIAKQQAKMSGKGGAPNMSMSTSSRQPQGPLAQAALAAAKADPTSPKAQAVFKKLGLNAQGN